MLGLDVLYVANEGRFVAFVPAGAAEETVARLREFDAAREACIIGTVHSAGAPQVTLASLIGATRIIDRLSGEQLPRIC